LHRVGDERLAWHSLQQGTVIAGKYRVERTLGEGAMGLVLLAHHTLLNEPVAIKLPSPHTRRSAEGLKRFLREARAVVKIKSEYVARVSDVGVLDSGEPFIVMEYLEGYDLARWLLEQGALPIEQAVEFVLQCCEALAEAHALGIIHRDVKPANLFCVRRPDGVLAIKLLDFGISKMSETHEGADGINTRAEAIMGSPPYMSPEQLLSAADVDARTDIWSIGVVLFELISGRRPFSAPSLVELTTQISNGDPPTIDTLCSHAPEGLRRALRRCLQKKRGDRYANVAELAEALSPFATSRARGNIDRTLRVVRNSAQAVTIAIPQDVTLRMESSPALPPLQSGPRGVSGGTESAFGQTGERAPTARKLWLLLVMGVALCCVIGGALAVLGTRQAALPEVSSASPSRSAAANVTPPGLATNTTPRPRPTTTSKVDCSREYNIDQHGLKHFKPECYLPDSGSEAPR